MGVGYLYVYGYLKSFEVSSAKAKTWESKIPFKLYASHPSFITVDGATGGSTLPTFIRANPPNI